MVADFQPGLGMRNADLGPMVFHWIIQYSCGPKLQGGRVSHPGSKPGVQIRLPQTHPQKIRAFSRRYFSTNRLSFSLTGSEMIQEGG